MVLAGMYAVAATTAATMAAGFSTTESTNRMQIVTFGTTLKQAAAEHRAEKYAFNPRMPRKPSGP